MNKETMTVHEALAELKMLDKRIEKAISTANFAVENKHNNTKLNGGMTVDEFVAAAEKSYQSITDMLRRRKAIRNAVAVSNASTKITVGGVEYMVSELIEMRSQGIELHCALLNRMTNQLRNAQMACARSNSMLDANADSYVGGLLGAKEKINSNEAMPLREAYITANTMEVVGLDRLTERANTLSDEVEAFLAEVDAKISISNALTVVEFEY